MKDEVTFFIDGKALQAPEGMPLVEAAKQSGIEIPTLCYFSSLPPLGTCRVCTVEVNGKARAACITPVQADMEVQFHTPELDDMRKALVEMMFAEGNHFCPSCEKSGNCHLQNWGYKMGISLSRFPLLFEDHLIDFHPKRMVLERNRCILCKRCVEEIHNDEGKSVFSFENRGHETVVSIDYEMEASLTEAQAQHAMEICPVGAILVRGKSESGTPGQRLFDQQEAGIVHQPTGNIPRIQKQKEKYVLATTSLAGCFGCHMSMLDIDLELLNLIELVDFHKSPLTDIKEFSQQCDIGLIEGGCCTDENVAVLQEFRKKCDILISIGECAIMGGIPAMRNMVPLKECLEEAYVDNLTSEPNSSTIPSHADIPKLLDKVYPCHEVVAIDYYIPGCPPDAGHIWKVIKHILLGESYSLLKNEFTYD